jgi:caa(3)-type oxidase subunit IV
MSEHAHPSYKNYVGIFISLAILTAATVAISKTGMSHGVREIFAFGIAALKTVLVATIFMHLKFETKTIIIFATVPVGLAILFILAISPDVGLAG